MLTPVDLARAACKTPFWPPELDRLAAQFGAALPFPHIVLDDFLNVPPDAIREVFPGEDWKDWVRWSDRYQVAKRFCGNIEAMPDLLQQIVREMSEPRFLHFLETVTGIPKLIPDPHLNGGGLHSSGAGGVLMPHTDFHIYERLGLYRRVNVILYLNEEWRQEWGGNLGLYARHARTPDREVVPSFGRLVVFRTDHDSIHGFADPVAEGRRRDSIAMYYYSAEETGHFSGDTTTYWRQHGSGGAEDAIGIAVYKALIGISAGFARLAHRWNPNIRARRRKPSVDH